jgi:electron transfer flavoprotein alpha subunit
MSVLVLADHSENILHTATASAVSAAANLGKDIDVLVAGAECQPVVNIATLLHGVRKILHADHPAYHGMLAEQIAPLLAGLGKNYRYIIAPATTTGKDILPRAAALLDAPQISDVMRIDNANTFVHPVYAGNALETVSCDNPMLLLTIRPTAFAPADQTGSAAVEKIAPAEISTLSQFVAMHRQPSLRPDLGDAGIVISGGRGLGSRENFEKLETLADKLGAAIGASRAAVDAGYAPNELQIGQTGRVVAPDLYIAVGISGAIQHLAGMKDSKIIVAINKDENAPIFEIADYALVDDLFNALPELEMALG